MQIPCHARIVLPDDRGAIGALHVDEPVYRDDTARGQQVVRPVIPAGGFRDGDDAVGHPPVRVHDVRVCRGDAWMAATVGIALAMSPRALILMTSSRDTWLRFGGVFFTAPSFR